MSIFYKVQLFYQREKTACLRQVILYLDINKSACLSDDYFWSGVEYHQICLLFKFIIPK